MLEFLTTLHCFDLVRMDFFSLDSDSMRLESSQVLLTVQPILFFLTNSLILVWVDVIIGSSKLSASKSFIGIHKSKYS